jgi:F-type H+-transporting ATPase subunit b
MLEINPVILLVQVITFLIALSVVWKLAWKPLMKFMQERQDSIKKSIDEAEQTRQLAAKLEEEYQAKLRQIADKSQELLNLAKAEAAHTKEELLQQAQAEAQAVRRKNQEQLAIERNAIIQELRKDIASLSLVMVEKVIRQSFDAGTQERYLKEILSEINTLEPAGIKRDQ